MKYDDWKPKGVDCKGFDYNQLAPGTVFEEDSCFLFDPNSNKRVNKKKEVPSSSAMRAIVAKVLRLRSGFYMVDRHTTKAMHNNLFKFS